MSSSAHRLRQIIEDLCRDRCYCWPSTAELARRYGSREAGTEKLLKLLEDDGSILRVLSEQGRCKRIGIILRKRDDPNLPAATTDEELDEATRALRHRRDLSTRPLLRILETTTGAPPFGGAQPPQPDVDRAPPFGGAQPLHLEGHRAPPFGGAEELHSRENQDEGKQQAPPQPASVQIPGTPIRIAADGVLLLPSNPIELLTAQGLNLPVAKQLAAQADPQVVARVTLNALHLRSQGKLTNGPGYIRAGIRDSYPTLPQVERQLERHRRDLEAATRQTTHRQELAEADATAAAEEAAITTALDALEPNKLQELAREPSTPCQDLSRGETARFQTPSSAPGSTSSRPRQSRAGDPCKPRPRSTTERGRIHDGRSAPSLAAVGEVAASCVRCVPTHPASMPPPDLWARGSLSQLRGRGAGRGRCLRPHTPPSAAPLRGSLWLGRPARVNVPLVQRGSILFASMRARLWRLIRRRPAAVPAAFPRRPRAAPGRRAAASSGRRSSSGTGGSPGGRKSGSSRSPRISGSPPAPEGPQRLLPLLWLFFPLWFFLFYGIRHRGVRIWAAWASYAQRLIAVFVEGFMRVGGGACRR